MQLLRSFSILLLVFCHMQAMWPMLAPVSLAAFILCHIDLFRLYRRPPKMLMLGFAFVAYYLFLLYIHGMLRDYSIIDLFRTSGRIAYMTIIFIIACHLRPEARIERPLFRSAMLCTTLISLLAIYSCYVSLIIVNEKPLSTERSLTGFFENHNTMAGTIGVVLLVAVGAYIHNMKGRWPQLVDLTTEPLILFLALSFALCLSRSYSIGMVVAMGALIREIPFPPMRRTAYVFGGLTGLALAVFVVVNRSRDIDSENIDNRQVLYTRAAFEFLKSPLIGIGPGAFQELQGTQNVLIPHILTLRRSGHDSEERTTHDVFGAGGGHVHNTYLQILCDFGMLGVLLFGLMAYGVWRNYQPIRIALQADNEPSPLLDLAEWNCKSVFYSTIFLAVSGLTVNWCFSSPPYTLLVYMALGRFVAMSHALEMEPESFAVSNEQFAPSLALSS